MVKLILSRKTGLRYGRFPGMNEYTKANRTSYHAGAEMKKTNQDAVCWAIKSQRIQPVKGPAVVHFKFYEPNRKRDLDNISGFAHKVILDALTTSHVLQGDGWKHVRGYSDAFYCDPENPRVEVYIEEVE